MPNRSMPPKFADLKNSEFDVTQRQKYVTELFDELAPTYDRFNRRVSFFRDEAWRQKTVALLQECAAGEILDLAAGTGDLSGSALKGPAQKVHIFDISINMLRQAKSKFQAKNKAANVTLEQGSADSLPFKDNVFDGIVSGFAMRNIYHFLDQVLQEMLRVLKPGGRFAILELSQPQNPVLKAGFKIHLKTIMPLIGKLTAGQSAPFQYLRDTTMTFLSPAEFRARLKKAGFEDVAWQTLLFGGIAIHFGKKPSSSL